MPLVGQHVLVVREGVGVIEPMVGLGARRWCGPIGGPPRWRPTPEAGVTKDLLHHPAVVDDGSLPRAATGELLMESLHDSANARWGPEPARVPPLAVTMQRKAMFPLTLTLSLGERESVSSALRRSLISELIPAPATVLPLLGERAEVRGKAASDCIDSALGGWIRRWFHPDRVNAELWLPRFICQRSIHRQSGAFKPVT